MSRTRGHLAMTRASSISRRPAVRRRYNITSPPIATATSRDAAMAAFLEAPFLPDPTQMRLDHITAMLALLLESPLRSTTLHMLYRSYTPENSTYIWSIWEPHIRLTSTHPLAERTLARDRILAMIQMEYTNPEHAAGTPKPCLTLWRWPFAQRHSFSTRL